MRMYFRQIIGKSKRKLMNPSQSQNRAGRLTPSPAPLLLNKLPSELKRQVCVSPASVHHRIINSGCYVHISFTVYSSLWKKVEKTTAINKRKTAN